MKKPVTEPKPLPARLAKKERKSEKRELSCVLTPEELRDASRKMCDCLQAVAQLKEDAKRAAMDYKAKIQKHAAEMMLLQNKITSETEMRVVDCDIYLSSPRAGMKEIVRLDTGEIIGAEEMSASELQRDLPIEDEPKADPAAALAGESETDGAAPAPKKRGRKPKATPTNIIPDGATPPDDPPINSLGAALPPGAPQAVENEVE